MRGGPAGQAGPAGHVAEAAALGEAVHPEPGQQEGEREADGPRDQGADEEDHEHGQDVRREPAHPVAELAPASFG